MSNKLKIILLALFIVQISVIIWARYDYESKKTPFERKLKALLENPENVKTLDFQAMNLSVLPEDILQFENVEIIDLSHNRLEHIPPVLYQLPNLKRLNLSHNRLREDVYIRRFEALTHLDLSFCEIQQFFGISITRTLKNINLSQNQMKSFPSIGSEIDTLDLSHNNIFDAQNIGVKIFKTIQHLDLSDNNLYDFEYAAPIMQWCYSVDLSNNTTLNGSTIPSTFFNENYRVKKLNLNNCDFDNIEELPASQIEVLDLGNNNLIIKYELVYQLKLKELNLENQNLTNFLFYGLNLKELNLVDVFYYGDLDAPNLEILHISNKNVENLPDFPKLKTIYFYSSERDIEVLDNELIDLKLKYPNAEISYRIINETY